MVSRREKGAAVLGRAMGAYSERPPCGALRRHFACTWFHALPAPDPRPAIIVPDGAVDLVWVSGELRVAGPDRVAAVEQIPPGATVVGVRFRPATARAWLGVPLSEVVGGRLPLERFWGREGRRIADWLGEADEPPRVARRLEHALARAIPSRPPDETGARIFEIVRERRNPETGVLDELERRLGLSERTLRRRCSDAVGYGPKTLDRVLRLQRFLALANAAPRLPLAALAADAGYADQAHLTREARALTGLTPGAILGQLRRALAVPFKT